MYMHMVSGESTGSSEQAVCGDSIQRVERSEIDAVNISEIAVGSDSDLFAAFVRDVLLEESLIDRVRSPGLSISDDDNYRSEEHTSELQSLMSISYAVFCLKKQKHQTTQ